MCCKIVSGCGKVGGILGLCFPDYVFTEANEKAAKWVVTSG